MKLGIVCVGRIASAVVISCAIPLAVSAGTFKSVATKDGKTIILLSGEIAEGDADTLKAAIKTANDAGKLVSGIRLNSPGGNILEALKLADAGAICESGYECCWKRNLCISVFPCLRSRRCEVRQLHCSSRCPRRVG
jgi:hypothetical protein